MKYLFVILCGLLPLSAWAQPSRSDLERQRQQIMESIRETQAQLAATRTNQRATISQLRALQAKLGARQKLIANYNEEISSIDNNIKSSSSEVSQLQRKLDMQKQRYAQSIRYAYQNRNSYNILTFLFSADDFNQALRRMRYLKKYREFRTDQVMQIRETQGAIRSKIGVLANQKTEKNDLLSTQQSQKQELEKETKETNAVVSQLKGREKELSSSIEKNRRNARVIDANINKIIQREIELAQKKAQEEERRKREEEQRRVAAANNYGGMKVTTGTGNAPLTSSGRPVSSGNSGNAKSNGGKPNGNSGSPTASTVAPAAHASAPPSYKLTLTPEAAALSTSFEANRGKLPWPVEKGFISLGFGTYTHPTETHIKLDNPGVTISTSAGAPVRAVFDGKVSSAFPIPGAGWTVLISHGQYYTVYSGLSSISVSKGQQVHIKQNVGVVGESDEGVPTINFQVWKVTNGNKTSKIDPSSWIAR